MIKKFSEINESTDEGKLLKTAMAYIIINYEMLRQPEDVMDSLFILGEQIYGTKKFYGKDD